MSHIVHQPRRTSNVPTATAHQKIASNRQQTGNWRDNIKSMQTGLMKDLVVSILLLIMGPASAAHAGARHFTYIYETVTSAPGSVDMENWVTWSRASNPQRADEVD